MSVNDISVIKDELREQYRRIRLDMTTAEREEADVLIAKRIQQLCQYQECHSVLCYVSTSIEIDTTRIIKTALQDGKRVAVPRCIPRTRQMEFYYINSMDELQPGAFGVLEPVAELQRLYLDGQRSLCIVPALSYDLAGYRLGFGKGYYDRYLSTFNGDTVGICYHNCVQQMLPRSHYDKPVSLLVTEQYTRRTNT